MPKNKGKGGKNRRRGKNENESEKRELLFKKMSKNMLRSQKCWAMDDSRRCVLME